MELMMIIITLLSIFFSALIPSSLSLQIQMQPSLHPQVTKHQPSVPTLPRKLRFTEEVKNNKARDVKLHEKEKKEGLSVSGKQNMVVGSKGTRQEWEEGEGEDPSEYFTMDYRGLRRQRPIHNKHLPVGP